jgi:hypothetical protein
MSPHIADPNLEKLRDEYLKQLLERYEARSKTFRTLLFGFVGFGFVFLLLVLFPFVGLRRQHYQVNQQMAAATDRAAALTAATQLFATATQGFTTLRNAIDSGAYELRDALPGLSETEHLGQPNASMEQQMVQRQMRQRPLQQQQAGIDRCAAEVEETARMNCRVGEQVRRQFDRYAQVLDSSVIAPMEALSPDIARPRADALRSGLDSIRAAFEARLAATPRFWERFGGKLDFFGELNRDVEGYWTQYGFEAQKDSLSVAKQRLDSASAALTVRNARLEKLEDGLAARLATIESPLGKLPIGLVEGVQIFPLLMAIGFAWCCAVLAELVSMRNALQTGYRERDPEQAVLTDRHLTLIAPLWVGDGDLNTSNRAASILLFSPVAIFLLGCTLVVYQWVRWSDADGVSSQDHWLYGSLYLLAAVGLVIALRRVWPLLPQVRTDRRDADT